jgi:hypothetical protein
MDELAPLDDEARLDDVDALLAARPADPDVRLAVDAARPRAEEPRLAEEEEPPPDEDRPEALEPEDRPEAFEPEEDRPEGLDPEEDRPEEPDPEEDRVRLLPPLEVAIYAPYSFVSLVATPRSATDNWCNCRLSALSARAF